MIKRDNHEVFETGWASGYEQANKEWNEHIDAIKAEIQTEIDSLGDSQEDTAMVCGLDKAIDIIDKYIGGD